MAEKKKEDELKSKIEEQQLKIEELQNKIEELTKKPETIATCSSTKAMMQCYKIAEKLEKWLTVTDVMNIRKKTPQLLKIPEIPDNANEEEERKIREQIEKSLEENDKRIAQQAKDNLFAILRSVMGEHPDETIELLAMFCFVDSKDKDNYSLSFYMHALADIFENESILRFFSSSVRLVLKLSKTV